MIIGGSLIGKKLIANTAKSLRKPSVTEIVTVIWP